MYTLAPSIQNHGPQLFLAVGMSHRRKRGLSRLAPNDGNVRTNLYSNYISVSGEVGNMHVATNLAFIRTDDNARSLVPVSATIINITLLTAPLKHAIRAGHP